MEERLERLEVGDGITLHFFPSSKFKTTEIHIFVEQELNENHTKTALLPLVLKRGCQAYETQKEIQVYLEELYGSAFDVGVLKKGEKQIMRFSLSIANTKYLPAEKDDILVNALQFLHHILTKPVLVDGLLKEQYVDQEKENLRMIIQSLINDKGEYATERCFQEMCANEKFSYYVYGKEEDLQEIDNHNLTDYYHDILSMAPMDIFIIGDMKSEKIVHPVKKVFGISREKIRLMPKEIIKKTTGPVKEVVEEMDVTQGKLVLGFRTNTPYEDKSYFPLAVYSSILGGGPYSKLFMNVREKASLAYYVYARLEKFKGLMLISAGIDSAQYKSALEIIQSQMHEIKEGKISSYEMESAKNSIITSLESASDDPYQMIDYYLGNTLKELELPLSDFIKRIQDVNAQEVIEVSRRIKMDTIYLLKNRKKGRVVHAKSI